MQEEVWKDVVGFENLFMVSESGKVFSKRTNKILKTWVRKNGYVTLGTKVGGRDGVSYCFKIHRLVADAFLDPPSKDIVETCKIQSYGNVIVRHLDNNKQNNHYTNLAWGTYQDNTNDWLKSPEFLKDKNGIENRSGHNHAMSKLTEDQVKWVRSVYKPKCKSYGCIALAKKFNVSHAVISSIILYKTYKNVK